MKIHTRLYPFAVLLLGACSQEPATVAQAPAPEASSMPAQAMPGCDRDCLNTLADDYLDALVAHDTSAVPLAGDIACVENVTSMSPGEGLWDSSLGRSDSYLVTVPDESLQQIGLITAMTRTFEGEPQDIIVGMRLKRNESGEIAEAEHLISRVRPEFLARLQAPRPGLLAEVPEASRMSREEMAAIALSYYDALDDNDGSLTPFADDCQRHENGMVTAGPEAGGVTVPGTTNQAPVARLCAAQLDSGSFQYIDVINNRRFIAADPVTGLAMGLSHFRHPMNNLPYEVTHTDGSTSERNADNMPFAPFDLPAAHIFKIGADGLVHEIEAMGFTTDLYSPTGWE